MEKVVFFKKLLAELELEESEIDESSPLHITSLQTLTLMSFLDEHFGIRVKVKDLIGIESVRKLMELIGKDKID